MESRAAPVPIHLQIEAILKTLDARVFHLHEQFGLAFMTIKDPVEKGKLFELSGMIWEAYKNEENLTEPFKQIKEELAKLTSWARTSFFYAILDLFEGFYKQKSLLNQFIQHEDAAKIAEQIKIISPSIDHALEMANKEGEAVSLELHKTNAATTRKLDNKSLIPLNKYVDDLNAAISHYTQERQEAVSSYFQMFNNLQSKAGNLISRIKEFNVQIEASTSGVTKHSQRAIKQVISKAILELTTEVEEFLAEFDPTVNWKNETLAELKNKQQVITMLSGAIEKEANDYSFLEANLQQTANQLNVELNNLKNDIQHLKNAQSGIANFKELAAGATPESILPPPQELTLDEISQLPGIAEKDGNGLNGILQTHIVNLLNAEENISRVRELIHTQYDHLAGQFKITLGAFKNPVRAEYRDRHFEVLTERKKAVENMQKECKNSTIFLNDIITGVTSAISRKLSMKPQPQAANDQDLSQAINQTLLEDELNQLYIALKECTVEEELLKLKQDALPCLSDNENLKHQIVKKRSAFETVSGLYVDKRKYLAAVVFEKKKEVFNQAIDKVNDVKNEVGQKFDIILNAISNYKLQEITPLKVILTTSADMANIKNRINVLSKQYNIKCAQLEAAKQRASKEVHQKTFPLIRRANFFKRHWLKIGSAALIGAAIGAGLVLVGVVATFGLPILAALAIGAAGGALMGTLFGSTVGITADTCRKRRRRGDDLNKFLEEQSPRSSVTGVPTSRMQEVLDGSEWSASSSSSLSSLESSPEPERRAESEVMQEQEMEPMQQHKVEPMPENIIQDILAELGLASASAPRPH